VSDKIKPHHLERKAILYVRQSSAYQVQNNLESQKLQYAMRDRLGSLGWHEIEIVDEDLGRPIEAQVRSPVSAAGLVGHGPVERSGQPGEPVVEEQLDVLGRRSAQRG